MSFTREEFQQEKEYIKNNFLFDIKDEKMKNLISEAVTVMEDISRDKLFLENVGISLTKLEEINIKRNIPRNAEGCFSIKTKEDTPNEIDKINISLRNNLDNELEVKTLRHELVHLMSQNNFDEKENGLGINLRCLDEIITEMYAKKIGQYLDGEIIKPRRVKTKQEGLSFIKLEGGYESIAGYAYALDAILGDEIFSEKFNHFPRLDKYRNQLETLDGILSETFANPNKENFKNLSKQMLFIGDTFIENFDKEEMSKKMFYNKYMDFREELLTYGTPQYIKKDLARLDKKFAQKILEKESMTWDEEGKLLEIINKKDVSYDQFLLESKLTLAELINIKVGNKTFITENLKEAKEYDKKVKKVESFEEILDLPTTKLTEITKNKKDYPYYMTASSMLKQGFSNEKTLREIKGAILYEKYELETSPYTTKANALYCDEDGRNLLYALARTKLNNIDFYYQVYEEIIKSDSPSEDIFLDFDKVLNCIKQKDRNGLDAFDYGLKYENSSFLAETINQVDYYGENLNSFLIEHISSIRENPNTFFDAVQMLSEHKYHVLEDMFVSIAEEPDWNKFPLKDIKNNKNQNMALYFESNAYSICSHGHDLGILDGYFNSDKVAKDFLATKELAMKQYLSKNGMTAFEKDKSGTSAWEYFLTLRDFEDKDTKEILFTHLASFENPYTALDDVSYEKIKNNPEVFNSLTEFYGNQVGYLNVQVDGIKIPLINAIMFDKSNDSMEIAEKMIPKLSDEIKDYLADTSYAMLESIGNKKLFEILLKNEINVFKENKEGISSFDKFFTNLTRQEVFELSYLKTNSGEKIDKLFDKFIENKDKKEEYKEVINECSFGTFLG